MTEALFREDAYLHRCEAEVLEITPEGAVILDRTVFYPTGGGQPGDAGALIHEGREIPVVTAQKGDGETVLHILAEGAAPPPAGAKIEARIDADMRDIYRRVHTCLHLLSVAVPLPVTGGQISAGKGRLDFDMPDAPEDKAAIEARLTALIAGDHPVSASWISDEELAARPELVKTMKVKPPAGQGRVRLIRIGAEQSPTDLQPCGGTHVRRTGEIGAVRIGKIEKKGRQNRRVYVHLEG